LICLRLPNNAKNHSNLGTDRKVDPAGYFQAGYFLGPNPRIISRHPWIISDHFIQKNPAGQDPDREDDFGSI